jgi:hypothetical protein
VRVTILDQRDGRREVLPKGREIKTGLRGVIFRNLPTDDAAEECERRNAREGWDRFVVEVVS